MQTLPWLFCGWGLDKTIRKLLSKTADLINDKCKFKQKKKEELTNDFYDGENS